MATGLNVPEVFMEKMMRALRIFLCILPLVIGNVCFSAPSRSAPSQKVVILYSSINQGQVATATALETVLAAPGDGPTNNIILKDIRDFQPGWRRKLGKAVYGYLLENYPKTFNRFYSAFLTKGNQSMTLANLKTPYNEKALEKYLEIEKPDTILATHFGAAQVLGNIRERGKLRDVKIGWLYTDFIPAYFPRISQRIDQTFVPSSASRQMWLEQGVEENRVSTAATPPQVASDLLSRKTLFSSTGLSLDVLTIAISLPDGASTSDYRTAIETIVKAVKRPVQIVAKPNLKEKMVHQLESQLKSKIITVADTHYSQYTRYADLVVAPTSYLSTTVSQFDIKPLVLVDSTPGIDHENARLFASKDLALVTSDLYELGDHVQRLLTDETLWDRMRHAQIEFRDGVNLHKIQEFVSSPKLSSEADFRLGIEAGKSVEYSAEALAELEKAAPADIEILLAYGKHPDGEMFRKDANPFGHIAVRIDDTVYTVNGQAKRGHESYIIHKTSLNDYLYGISRHYMNEEHTDTFGEAYARHNLSIRVSGVSPAQKAAMLREVERHDATWIRGEWSFDGRENNCADFSDRLLKAGGFLTPEQVAVGDGKVRRFTVPLDVFDRYLSFFTNDVGYRVELVGYTYVPDSKNLYSRTTFPISPYKPLRMIKNMLGIGNGKFEEAMVTKRLAVYPGSYRVTYENVSGTSVENAAVKEQKQRELEQEYQQLVIKESELERLRADIDSQQLKAANVQEAMANELARFTSAETQFITEGKSLLDPERQKLATHLQEVIAQWDQRQKEYQSNLDALIVQALDHFAKKVLFYVTSTNEELQFRVSPADRETLAKLTNETRDAYQNYLNLKHVYGQAKDIPRTHYYRLTFEKAREFIDQSDRMMKAKNYKLTLFERLKEYGPTLKKYILYVKLSGKFLKSLASLVFKSSQNMSYMGHLNEFFRLFTKEVDYKVEVQGREIVDKAQRLEPGIVNIFAPVHRNPVLDFLAYSHLGIDDALPFIFFPKPSSQILGKAFSNVIVVGGGSDVPIENTIKELKKGYTRNIVIYPEGSVSAGMMETRPPREKFSWGLLRRLRNEGYKINLVPIVYENTARFTYRNTIDSTIDDLVDKSNPPVTLKVVVGQPLDTKMLDIMLRMDPQSINRYLRATWLEGMPTDANVLSGQLRAKSMDALVGQFKTKPSQNMCKKLFLIGD